MAISVGSLCLIQFIDVAAVTVVVTALPRMLSDLGAPAGDGSLVSTAYAMFFGGFLMLGARLGDRVGHRRAILGSLVVFAVASLVVATAGSIAVLTVGRCGQGVAAAVSVPSGLRMLSALTTEGAQRRRAIAAWSATGAAAGASGFVIGGVVTALVGWRVIFVAAIPLSAVLAGLIAWSVPGGDPTVDGSLNVAGALLLTASIMGVVLGATTLGQRDQTVVGIGILCAATICAFAFAVVDRRAVAPLLPRQLRRARGVRLGAFGSSLNTATTSSVMTLATLYLQDSLGRSPLAAAFALLPFSAAVVVGSLGAPVLLRRLPAGRVSGIGLLVIGAGDALVVVLVAAHGALPPALALAGAGIGISSVAATTVGLQVPAELRGSASGVINSAAQLGTAIGVAVLLLAATRIDGFGPVSAHAFEWSAGIAATAALLAAAVMMARGGRQPAPS